MNSLEKLILPMYFLKADNVVAYDKSTEVVMFPFPGKSVEKTGVQ